MNKYEKFGLLGLAKKTLAVLTASLTTLVNNEIQALPRLNNEDGHTDLNYENFKKKFLKPKLILKLNLEKPEQSLVVMHTSHSSHSSHASHSSYTPPPGHYSHSSHSSHISSSPSYSPSSIAPLYTPRKPKLDPSLLPYTPSITFSNSSPIDTAFSAIETANSDMPYYILGSRILYKGCKGTDVQELQQLLLDLGYQLQVNGFFDSSTYTAVTKFQKRHALTVDGVVGNMTLIRLQSQ